MSLNKVFNSVKSRTSGLLNSGIIARAPNIFSVFLFDYTISAVPYKLFVNNSAQAVTTTGTSHSDQLHYIIKIFEAVCCKVFFFLLNPVYIGRCVIVTAYLMEIKFSSFKYRLLKSLSIEKRTLISTVFYLSFSFIFIILCLRNKKIELTLDILKEKQEASYRQ